MNSLRVIGFGMWAVLIVIGLIVAAVEVRNTMRSLDETDR